MSDLEGTPRPRKILQAVFLRSQGDTAGAGDVGALVRDVGAVVAGIRFDASALPVVALEYEARTDGCYLVVILDVLDVETGEPLTVGRAAIVPWEVLVRNGAAYVLEWTRETIANLMAHEVAECLTFEGAKVFDVHPRQLPATAPAPPSP